jgi:O-antigen ligase
MDKSKISWLYQKHPDPRLQLPWNFAQIGVLFLAFLPILGIVSMGLALIITYNRQYKLINYRWINRGFALLSLLLIVVSLFANDKLSALLGLANLIPLFLFFAAYSQLIQTPAQLRQIGNLLLLGVVPILFFGYGQMLFGMTSPAFLEAILGTIVKPGGNPPGRMASIFMYANILAIYLQIIFILSLGFWLEELQQYFHWQQVFSNLKNSSNSPKLRLIFLSFLVLATGGALVMTSSRNSWSIAFLAVLAFAVYQGWKFLVWGVVGFMGAILWSAFGVDPSKQWLRGIIPRFIWARLSDEMNPNRPTADLRETQWQFAIQLTGERPIVGWGLRNFTQLYQAKTQFWLGHPHNLFLMLSAETGIITTFLFAGLVGWVMSKTIQILQVWSQVFSVVTADVNSSVNSEINLDVKPDMSLNTDPETNQTNQTNQTINSQLINQQGDRLIIFTYLITFSSCVLFNLLDVSLFDIRVNLLGWLLLSAIGGIVNHYQGILLWQKLDHTFK